MSWRQLILKNALGHARRYIGYLASSAVAVMVFFMFACFLYNPTVEHSHMTSTAQAILTLCQYIVIAFAVFFIFFFHSALLRLRGREFGLFLVLGARPGQIGQMVLFESILMAAAAMVVGMAAGAGLTKLFLMAMDRLLQLPVSIPFQLPARALHLALAVFGCVFLAEALFTAWRIRRRTPRALMLGQRAQQKPPRFSWWLVFLSLACLAAAYDLALAYSKAVVATMVPILILTGLGTYLLYSQVSVMVLSHLRKRSGSGKQILVVGRLAHRIRDNARVLTVVTMLAAVVITSMGGVFGLQHDIQVVTTQGDPYTLMVAEQQGTPLPVSAQQARSTFEAHHFAVRQQTTLPVLVLPFRLAQSKSDTPVYVMSASTFERTEAALRQSEPTLRKYLPVVPPPRAGHAFLQLSPAFIAGPFDHATSGQVVVPGHDTQPIVIDRTIHAALMNTIRSAPMYTLVVPDQDYAQWSAMAPGPSHWTMHAFLVSNWQHAQSAIQEMYAQIPRNVRDAHYESPVPTYAETEQLFSTMIFAGMFVSVLFFLACGSALYFRLQAQLEEDQRQFTALRRIGLQTREAKSVLTRELLLLFAAPVLFGLAHSVVAILDLTHLLPRGVNIWPDFGIVVGIFAGAMVVYLVVARFNYLRRVIPGLQRGSAGA
ncbi:MAG: ABC transporter permease [Alicyclobacillus sp.]|nr:ABC transporter permease [Alicyclobacillus sp.]